MRSTVFKVIGGALCLVALSGMPSASASTAASASGANSTTTVKSSGSSTRLATIKTKTHAAIENRLTALGKLTAAVNASKNVTAENKSGLLAEISADESGLTALDTQIQADATATVAATDAKKIVADFRVYALEVPKVHEVLAIDTVVTVDATFQASATKLALALQAQKTKGTDVSAAESALTDLNTKASAISTAIPGGLATSVLALQPGGYPANRTTLQSTRKSLATAVTDAKGARTDVQTIGAALGKSAAATSTTSTTVKS